MAQFGSIVPRGQQTYRIWKAAEHSNKENVQWAWLRAVEWTEWPLFISQPIVPTLLYFYHWSFVLGLVVIATVMWKVLVVPCWVSPRLAWAGPAFVQLKFLTCPSMAYLLWQRGETALAAGALLWPLLGIAIANFIMVFPDALLSFTSLGKAAQVGSVQARFLWAIGSLSLEQAAAAKCLEEPNIQAPAPPYLRPVESFTSASEYHDYYRSLGFAVPVHFGYQVSRCMRERGLTFPEAYRYCVRNEIITEVDGVALMAKP